MFVLYVFVIIYLSNDSFGLASFSASVAGASGAAVSAGASEGASVGAALVKPGLKRGLGLMFSLGPGRSETGLTPGLRLEEIHIRILH